MPIKNLTLGLCLLLSGAAFADSHYRVREGDTLSDIASRFHCSARSIARANDLGHAHRIHAGMRIVIPSSGHSESGAGLYVVRNGDFDWAIARRYGVSEHALHQLNPDVDWSSLQIGAKIHVPGHGGSVARATPVVKVGKARAYKVAKGENDWIIAHRAGITTRVLRACNPGVDLSMLHPGQTIHVPGGSISRHEKINRIHTHYALVNSDDVTIRRGPSTDKERVTTVDQGTRVVVLDREGPWYKLRFPKGTVGWIRGDFLNPAHKVRVAHAEHRTRYAMHRSRRHRASMDYVAMDTNVGTDADTLLKRARSYTRTRYSWGSASRSASDCSGFVGQVYRSAGVRLPRTSREQASTGQPVKRGQMKAGDLVFFRTMRGHRVSHVGIYMGNNNFIHMSSGTGGLRVSSLSEGYYNHRFVGARRVKKFKSHSKSHASSATHEDAVPSPEGIATN